MSLLLFDILILLQLYLNHAYVLLPIQQDWAGARSQCSTKCNSHLASIHSESQYDETYQIAQYVQRDIWIGLIRDDASSQYIWDDQSNFTYGSPYDANNPWSNTDQSSSGCVKMNSNDNYLWTIDPSCNSWSPGYPYFLCNTCSYSSYQHLKTYYVSPILSYNATQGQIYCTAYCQSELASIHNEIDMQRIKELAHLTHGYDKIVNGSKNIDIGLYRPASNAWPGIWLDGSSYNGDWSNYDYAYPPYNHNTDPYYPWYEWADFAEPCTQILDDHLYQFQSHGCSAKQRFVCNSCDGKINKYIIHTRHPREYREAHQVCSDRYNTTLASIHTENDANELGLQLTISDINEIWIGLDDIDGTGTYSWSDGTGSANDIGYDSGKCVYVTKLANGTFTHSAAECDGDSRAFVCASPSEFCNGNNWNRYNGQWSHHASCAITNGIEQGSNITDPPGPGNIISNKQWINKNGLLSIQFMFKLVGAAGDDDIRTAGITLHNFKDTICDYYFIAIKLISADPIQFELQFIKNVDEAIEILDTVNLNAFGFQATDYHVFDIKVYNGTHFEIRIDDNPVLNVTDTTNLDDLESEITSGYIGINSYSIQIEGKWLYISGSLWDLNKNSTYLSDFKQCNVTLPASTQSPFNSTDPPPLSTTEAMSTTSTWYEATTETPSTSPTTTTTTQPTESPTSHREVIWKEPMQNDPTSNNLANWTIIAENNIQRESICPNQGDCWELCGQRTEGQTKVNTDAYMFRVASTIGFQNISLTFSIKPWQMIQSGEYCEISYRYDTESNWISLHNASGTNEFLDEIVDLPLADENIEVGIKILAMNGINDCCRLANFELSGIRIITDDPTTNPTQNPSENPTIFSSESPSESPVIDSTTMPPITSFPTTSTPTEMVEAPQPTEEGDGIVNEDAKTTINGVDGREEDEEKQNGDGGAINFMKQYGLAIGGLAIGCAIMCIFFGCIYLCYRKIKYGKSKTIETNTIKSLALTKISSISEQVATNTNCGIYTPSSIRAISNDNILPIPSSLPSSSYKTPGPPPRKSNNNMMNSAPVIALEMEGGLSFIQNDGNAVLTNHPKSRTDEFKQMLGDNRLGNDLIMDDIIDEMVDEEDAYETNSDMHVTAGGPDGNLYGEGVGVSDEKKQDEIPTGPHIAMNDVDIILPAKKTIGGDEARLARDEFIIDEDVNGDQYETPMGNDIVVMMTKGGDNHDEDEDENVPAPPPPPAMPQNDDEDAEILINGMDTAGM